MVTRPRPRAAHRRSGRRRPLPRAERPAHGRDDLRQVPRRDRHQRRGRRRPARPPHRGADQGRPGRLRQLRARGAGRLRRRRVVRRDGGAPADPGGLLRARPAGGPAAAVLPAAGRARPDPDRRRRALGPRRERPGVLGHRHRRQRRARPHHPAGDARAPRPPDARIGAPHRARPRLAPDVLALARGGARRVRAMLDSVTVVVGNRAEVEVAVGTRDPHEAADRLLAHGVELALVKMGADGVLVATPTTGPSCRPTWSRSSAVSAPATPSAALWSTACWPAGSPQDRRVRQRRRRGRRLAAGVRRRHAHRRRARRARHPRGAPA